MSGKIAAEDQANSSVFRTAPIPMVDVFLYNHHEKTVDTMNSGTTPQKNSIRKPRYMGKIRRFKKNNGR